MDLKQIRQLSENKMLELGADSFGYWDVGAFCFAGEENAVSVSGKNTSPQTEKSKKMISLTIDLSRQYNNIWGDYARTIIIENGQAVEAVSDIPVAGATLPVIAFFCLEYMVK